MSCRVRFLQNVASGRYMNGDLSYFFVPMMYDVTLSAPPPPGTIVGATTDDITNLGDYPDYPGSGYEVRSVFLDLEKSRYLVVLGTRVINVENASDVCKRMIDFGWQVATLPLAGKGGMTRTVKVVLPHENFQREGSEHEIAMMAYDGVRFRRVEKT